MIKLVIRYFARIYREVTKLAPVAGRNRFYLLFDYLSAFLFHGAHIFQYTVGGFWRKSNAERSKCLTWRRITRMYRKYNDSSLAYLFKNKPEFNQFFKEYIHRAWLYLRDASFDEFKAFVLEHQSVIIKPVAGKEGIGIRKFTLSGEDDARLRAMFDNLVAEDVIVEQLIVQHPDMVFGNASVNTVRVLTVCRPNGNARVMKAFLRAGVGNSLVDNTALGGFYYEIDVATGVLSSQGISKDGDLCIVHPGSGRVMLGFKVPHWDQVVNTCLQAAQRVPQVAMVGWDVAVTSDGIDLVEGNDGADYQGYEFIGTTGYYEKIKQFLK